MSKLLKEIFLVSLKKKVILLDVLLFLSVIISIVDVTDRVMAASVSTVIDFHEAVKQPKVKARYFTIQIGDSTKALYDPSINMDLWQGECKFKVNLSNSQTPMSLAAPVVSVKNGKPSVQLSSVGGTHKMYVKSNAEFEWETTFTSKPTTNVFVYDITTQGLNFFYQPALTAQDIADGCFRPDSVVGSYAVYHSSKRDNRTIINGNDTTYEDYKVGKAFHIYRPRVWDASGDTVWADLLIDTILNKLSITVDAVWLNKAVYPVVIDPTFGNTTGGASGVSISQFAVEVAYNKIDTTGAGTVDTAYLYVKEYLSAMFPDSAGIAYYDYDATVANCDLKGSINWVQNSSSGVRWIYQSINGDLHADDSAYVIAFQLWESSSSNLRYRYDTGSTCAIRKSGYSAMGFPSTLTGFGGCYLRDLSTYIKYTVSGGASPTRRRRMVLLNQ
ncbi:MAG: hypothetical protein ACE5D6_03240 [Candidatus Zixiibacteriota bacterium]